MNEQIPLLNYIRSNKFILYVAIFTVIALSPTTYFVFYSFSIFASPYREIASAAVAAIVASSIMIYTLRKNYNMALYYSIFEVTISSYYYIAMVVGWDWALIPALSFALVLPASVYHYAREIDVKVEPKVEVKERIRSVTKQELEDWLEKNPDKHPSDYFDKN